MSGRLAEGVRERSQVNCGQCGRALGRGYYFVCHICGATYCYAHMPVRCDHARARPIPSQRIVA